MKKIISIIAVLGAFAASASVPVLAASQAEAYEQMGSGFVLILLAVGGLVWLLKKKG